QIVTLAMAPASGPCETRRTEGTTMVIYVGIKPLPDELMDRPSRNTSVSPLEPQVTAPGKPPTFGAQIHGVLVEDQQLPVVELTTGSTAGHRSLRPRTPAPPAPAP